MSIKPLFVIASIGIVIALTSIYVYNERSQAQQPLTVNYNPYEKGVYATGIIESSQPTGSNINIYPEVSGRIMHIFVKDGQTLSPGTPLLAIEDSVQRELVAKDSAQIEYAKANLVNFQQQFTKIDRSYLLNKKSISKNALDNASNAVNIAKASLDVAQAQYNSDKALLNKYIIYAPIGGMVLRVVPTTGDYVSPQGTYDTYTQSMLPVIQMGIVTPYLEVRCFLDEILVPRLPAAAKLTATMFIRGENNKGIPLQFVNIQPYTIPKIQLSDEKTERVDVRVLPIVFKFKRPTDVNVYPGQLVDIYLQGKS